MMLLTRAPFTVTGVKTEILLLSYLFHKATKGGRKFVQILLLLNARNIKQLSWDPGSYSLKVSVWNFCFEWNFAQWCLRSCLFIPRFVFVTYSVYSMTWFSWHWHLKEAGPVLVDHKDSRVYVPGPHIHIYSTYIYHIYCIYIWICVSIFVCETMDHESAFILDAQIYVCVYVCVGLSMTKSVEIRTKKQPENSH